jgi:hypothetical protein
MNERVAVVVFVVGWFIPVNFIVARKWMQEFLL